MTNLDHLLLERRVDALLDPWRGEGPGMMLGLVQGGALTLHRSAGLADLGFGVPIGPDTRFRIASVSKQFTCAAIMILSEAGLVALDAPARDYLPELPSYQWTITVEHLMHNTSGLRDMLEVMRFGGADLGTPLRPEHLLEGICRQRTLNFPPGTRFLYSNSNFLLLGLIVERVSGQKLGAFLEERIFAPLGMTDTQLTPAVELPVARLATGYLPAESGWTRARHAFPLGGEGGLVSSVTDLALWVRNFATRRVGGTWLDQLKQQTPFPDGSLNRYARGLVARPYRGLSTWSHGGLWPGYRTELLMVPDADVAVIAIANAGSADPNKLAHHVLDAVLETRHDLHPVPKLPALSALEALAGRYVDPEQAETLDVVLAPDGMPNLLIHGVTLPLEAETGGRLRAARASSPLALRPDGDDAIEVEQDAGVRGRWRRVPPGAPVPPRLAGRYRSDEMATDWTIAETGGTLTVTARGPVASGPPWTIEPIMGDLFRVSIPGALYKAWLDVRAVRDGETVIALVANGGRVKHVRLERIEA